jgi:hypothetical protein
MATLQYGSNAQQVKKELSKIFATHGISLKIISDNGPPYNSHVFAEFCAELDIDHVTMSPGHSQTNGLAEKGVQIAKRLLTKAAETQEDISLMLLNLRNAPAKEKGSPAQRLMGRRTRTVIPTVKSLLEPQTVSPDRVRTQKETERETAKKYYDRKSKDLKPIAENDALRIRSSNKSWEPALLFGKTPNPRSYKVRTEEGRVLRRNKKDLLTTKEKNNFQECEQEYVPECDQNPDNPNLVPIHPTLAPPNVNDDAPRPRPPPPPPNPYPGRSRFGRELRPNPKFRDFVMS